MYNVRYKGLTDREFAKFAAYDFAMGVPSTPEKIAALVDLLTRIADTLDDGPIATAGDQMELALT